MSNEQTYNNQESRQTQDNQNFNQNTNNDRNFEDNNTQNSKNQDNFDKDFDKSKDHNTTKDTQVKGPIDTYKKDTQESLERRNIKQKLSNKAHDVTYDARHSTAIGKKVDNIQKNLETGKNNLNAFKDAKGFKNKAKSLGGAFFNDFSNTNAGQKFLEILEKIGKVLKVIKANAKLIAIVSAIVTLVWNLTIFGISLAQAIGTSPHYYCDLDPDDGTKQLAVYKQYCTSGSLPDAGNGIAERMSILCFDTVEEAENSYSLGGGTPHDGAPENIQCGTLYYLVVHELVLATDTYWASCDRGSCAAIRWSGVDDSFPAGGTTVDLDYLRGTGAERWEEVTDQISSNDDLLPGDVFCYPDGNGETKQGHIWIYLGPEAVAKFHPDVDAETYCWASASFGSRPPALHDDNSSAGYIQQVKNRSGGIFRIKDEYAEGNDSIYRDALDTSDMD